MDKAALVPVAVYAATIVVNVLTRMFPASDVVTWIASNKVGALALALVRKMGGNPVGLIEKAEQITLEALQEKK